MFFNIIGWFKAWLMVEGIRTQQKKKIETYITHVNVEIKY